jgi:hypothetical protein
MKTADEVRGRLEKLRIRYLRQYCAAVRARLPHNCVHNCVHMPTLQKTSLPTEVELAPRIVSTLVVMEPQIPVRLCLYGSDKPDMWNGDVCDADETARECPHFEARVTEEQAVAEFEGLMADDSYVLDNHKDVAALQWVLGERVFRIPLSLWDRFAIWLDRALRFHRKPVGRLPPAELPGDLWHVDAQDSGKRPSQIAE